MKELKEFDYFKAWLIFFLVATVGGWLVGLVIGSFVAAFLGAGGMPLAQMTRILQITGYVIIIPISYVTFRAVVGKFLFPKLWGDDAPPST
jgi:cation transporter-like permease